MSIETIFLQRQEQFTQAEQAAQQRYNQIAFWRLVWFIGSGVVIGLLWRMDQQFSAIVGFLIALLVFLYMLKKHQHIGRERDENRHLAFINQDEAARLKRHYLRPETGEHFASPAHAYAGDLDVFGRHSLFRLLNRTHTHPGQSRLATWLLTPVGADAVRLRQQAVAELMPQLNWRQRFEALAYAETTIGKSPDDLIGWAAATPVPLPTYLNAIRFLLPVATVGVLTAWLLGYMPGVSVTLMLCVHGFILSRTAARAKDASEQTFEISVALRAFRDLFKQAQQLNSQSVRLMAIEKALQAGGRQSFEAIGQLAHITEGLNYRRNPYFYLLVGLPSLWDIHQLVRLERWRKQYGPELAHWFDALGELEALNSLAGFAYAHPDYATPDIVDHELTLTVRQAVHPLLPPDQSVANSLSLLGGGKTVLITGSNMSGKSTFLRTIGTNTVLALMGAVVSAEAFSCSPVRVFTSMRTNDSLEESTSSFYAELKRLQTLIGLTKQLGNQPGAIPVLYFLDEILKGTNSADRHQGAEALIRQLHRTRASGFVSTHDLELGQLSDTRQFVYNYHFQSELDNGVLRFDYTLREGICTSFNASQLMQAIGIEMDNVRLR